MAISWSNPWLLLLLLPIAYLLFTWWKKEQRFNRQKKQWIFVIRLCIFLLLTLSLARTDLLFPEEGRSVVFVVDRSASIADEQTALNWIEKAIKSKRPEDRFSIVSVGEKAVVEQAWSKEKTISSFSTVINRHATDLASGLRLASGMLADTAKGKVIVLSDGQETQGNAQQEMSHLKQRGIPVETVSLAGKSGPEVLVEQLNLPKRLYQGDKSEVEVIVKSNVKTETKILVREQGKILAEKEVIVEPGTNRFAFPIKVNEDGFSRYEVEIEPNSDTTNQNNQAYTFSEIKGEPRVLIVEKNPKDSANLVAALTASGTKVDRFTPGTMPTQLESLKRYASIVLVNVPAYQFNDQQIDTIHSAVRDLGIGLSMVGGEESYALGGWFETPIEKALPVYMDVKDKKRLPSLGLVLVIDKSGSMSGEKLELAKEAAVRSAQLLSAQDHLGVLAFDDGFQWVVEPKQVKNKKNIEGWIRSVPSDGGTDIFPALDEAYKKAAQLPTKRKHVILLTDGQAPNKNFQALASKFSKKGVTLSTIAVGKDADQKLLRNLAKWGKGRSYQALNPQSIPTIFSKETVLSKRAYLINKPFIPKVTGGKDWDLGGLPPLRGYVGTSAKQTAEKVLGSPFYDDPVLARWQYGLGRTVAFTSDTSGVWSKEWVNWPGFAELWNKVIGWTFPKYNAGNIQLQANTNGDQPQLEVFAPLLKKASEIEFEIIDGNAKKQKQKIKVKAVSPGTFRGVLPSLPPGTYMLQGTTNNSKNKKSLGTFGLAIPYSNEYRSLGSGDNGFMKDSKKTSPQKAFANTSEGGWSKQEISLWLLLLATVLWPIDIAIRRLDIQSFSWRRFVPQKKKNTESSQQITTFAQVHKRSKDKVTQRSQRHGETVFKQSDPKQTTNHIGHIIEEKVENTSKKEKQQTSEQQQGSHVSRLLQAKDRLNKRKP